jgi:hypothetical protein
MMIAPHEYARTGTVTIFTVPVADCTFKKCEETAATAQTG